MWANSAATEPPPTMTMLAGSSSIRMMVSEVQNSTPASAITGGIVGRAPVATTMWSAVIRVASSMTSSCGPAKRARPSNSVTWSASARWRRPAAETRSILENVRSRIDGQSTPVTSASMPKPGAVRAWTATSAVCTRILLGMQPRLRQVPPKTPASISATGPRRRGPARGCYRTRTR